MIAVDCPGQRDIIDGSNGLIVSDTDAMANALQSIDERGYFKLQERAYETSKQYQAGLVGKLIACYERTIAL